MIIDSREIRDEQFKGPVPGPWDDVDLYEAWCTWRREDELITRDKWNPDRAYGWRLELTKRDRDWCRFWSVNAGTPERRKSFRAVADHQDKIVKEVERSGCFGPDVLEYGVEFVPAAPVH
jgi:hypothetical protein